MKVVRRKTKYCSKPDYCGQKNVMKDTDSLEAVAFCEAGTSYRCPFMTEDKVLPEMKLDRMC